MPHNTYEKTTREKMEEFLYSTPVEVVVYLLIILSVGMIAIEIAEPVWFIEHKYVLDIAEMFFIGFFSVEYISKLIVAKDKWMFFRRYFIDLLAILPFLRFFRLFRGFRILRLLRVVRLLRLGNMVARQISKMEGARNMREVIIIISPALLRSAPLQPVSDLLPLQPAHAAARG